MKRIFLIMAFIFLIPWPVAYAYDFTANAEIRQPVQVTAAVAASQPTWTTFGKAIGSVKAGDLFYIDATDHPEDISVTLYLTNAAELAGQYRYLILKTAFSREDIEGGWQPVASDTFLTMRNGQVSVSLPGDARYKVSIEKGSFYHFNASPADAIAPTFYLEAS